MAGQLEIVVGSHRTAPRHDGGVDEVRHTLGDLFGSSRERFPVDMITLNILMQLLLCKSYECRRVPVRLKGQEVTEIEARQEADRCDVVAGLVLGVDASPPVPRPSGGNERHGPVLRVTSTPALRTIGGSSATNDWAASPGPRRRVEHRPGFWSPYYVLVVDGGRVAMLAAPTATVVNYPTAAMSSRDDGITVALLLGLVRPRRTSPHLLRLRWPAAPDAPPVGSPTGRPRQRDSTKPIAD